MNLISQPGDDIVEDGSTFKVAIDEEGRAYNGSTRLHLQGKVSQGHIITNKLYATTATLKEGNKFSFILDGDSYVPEIAL